MNRLSIASLTASLLFGTIALVATAQAPTGPSSDRAPFWPKLDGAPKLTEWYSDVPWHQKLGTYAANEIIAPMIFPYEILPAESIAYCSGLGMTEERCMLETGVANILGYRRIDTLYSTADEKIKAAGECQLGPRCIEVRLEVSNFMARVSGGSVALQPEVIGKFTDQPVYGGFYITDGSTYAQQMLWEMAHYCDSLFSPGDMQDPVCYGDYFSPMNDGFHVIPSTSSTNWPRSVPWSVWPAGPPPQPDNQCNPGDFKCVMVLAGFNMTRVPGSLEAVQYNRYNKLLMQWFSNAMVAFPKEISQAKIQRNFPWNGKPVTYESFVYPLAVMNPFLGAYAPTAGQTAPAVQPTCDTDLNGPVWQNPPEPAPPGKCTDAPHYQAAGYVYPRECSLDDIATAATGSATSADKLRLCGANYEIHPNGWLAQWPTTPVNYRAIVREGPFNYDSNQYGRTSFVFGGVPGMQMPVSFYKPPESSSGLSVYAQVNNASIFSLFLPAANIDDTTRAMAGRNYGDTGFYHTLLMSNHMESEPQVFAEGIRGKVLWHNEYRMLPMYKERGKYTWLRDRTFDAAFDPLKSKYDPSKAPAPFHNNTCDGCHVRNGSGVPINSSYKLDPLLQEFMKDAKYVPYANGVEIDKDYTFTGQIRPMKLVFFDLQRTVVPTSLYSRPLNASAEARARAPRTVGPNDLYYNNKIMNFYGDSFHVTPPGAPVVFDYTWWFKDAEASRIVATAPRTNTELGKTYKPQQVHLDKFTTPQTDCQFVLPSPTTKPWPQSCDDIASAAILDATNGGQVGYMLLNGKRLGNLSAIEAIPNGQIVLFQQQQVAKLGAAMAGEIAWAPGSRDGVKGKTKLNCRTKSFADCYIGRFGWLGDRVSLEDQVANAAFVEMNMLTTEGYNTLYQNTQVASPIRYKYPNCGAANKLCVESAKGNSDLTEQDITRMAEYARWLGNPTRSEVQVSQPEVQAGETIFKRLSCDTCHVIKRIDIDPEDTMLTASFRERLKTRVTVLNKPFLSYIGTDLLMHDMGYLSQVGNSTQPIRDADGVVKPGFEAFVQKLRTPPLKGLRFNNYVTDAHRNTKTTGAPGCDFLLHDGRACDAIEAALLHDGPAIKKLQVIEQMGKLTPTEVMQLRAFLYSL